MKTITITLEVKEIIFDIQNKTFLTGRSREAETARGFEAASLMQASDDDENSYQIRRSISDTYCDIESEFADFIPSQAVVSTNLVNQAVDNDGQLVMTLSLPSNFNGATVANLGSMLHQCIVNRAIADWYNITNKTEAGEYYKASDEALQSAKRSLYRRLRPTRPLYP